MMDGWGGGWGSWLAMSLLILLVLALGVWAISALVRAQERPSARERRDGQPRPEPEAILAERLAEGEIDPDEYHAGLDALHSADRRGERPWPRVPPDTSAR